MTDKEKLDKLVAEIKGLRKEVKDNIAELGNSESERIGLFKDLEIYDNILSFIDSMQEEPVGELEKAAYQSGYAAYPVDMAEEFGGVIRDNNRYQRSSYTKGFKEGANWQKQQMMKDAISAKVTEIYYPTDSCLEIEATLPEDRFEDGDKVLIIKE